MPPVIEENVVVDLQSNQNARAMLLRTRQQWFGPPGPDASVDPVRRSTGCTGCTGDEVVVRIVGRGAGHADGNVRQRPDRPVLAA